MRRLIFFLCLLLVTPMAVFSQSIAVNEETWEISRDFRYLGTIGLFDAIHLPLKQGENEVLLAVSETFGGWGIISRLADSDGITVEQNMQHSVRQTAR